MYRLLRTIHVLLVVFVGFVFASVVASQDKSAAGPDRKIQLRFPVAEERVLSVLVTVGDKEANITASPLLKQDEVIGVELEADGISYRVRVDKESLVYELTAGNLTVGRSFVVNDAQNRPLFQFALQDKQPVLSPTPVPPVAKPDANTDAAIQDILKPKEDKPKP